MVNLTIESPLTTKEIETKNLDARKKSKPIIIIGIILIPIVFVLMLNWSIPYTVMIVLCALTIYGYYVFFVTPDYVRWIDKSLGDKCSDEQLNQIMDLSSSTEEVKSYLMKIKEQERNPVRDDYYKITAYGV